MDSSASASTSTPSTSRRGEDVSRAFHVVHRTLSPRIAVLSSPDVDDVLRPNNLSSLSDCLQRFEESLQGITVRTSQLESKQCQTFPIRFDPLSAFSNTTRSSSDPEPSKSRRDERPEEILDRVTAHVSANSKRWESKASELQVSSEEDAKRIIDSPIETLTPWFLDGRDIVLKNRTISRHETFGHPVGVLLAVSSLSPDPLNAFASLYAATQPQVCDAFRSRPYVDPNILRYYVLVHDCAQGGDMEESKQILESVKRIYGLNCCILPLNLESPQKGDTISTEPSTRLTDVQRSISQSSNASRDEVSLTEDDGKRLSGLIREMVAQSLIPWMENCVSQWNDSIAASRKGLTGRLFGAGKKFFSSSAISRSGSNTQDRPSWDVQGNFYPHAAIEAQTRRLADFAFMIRDYKLAAAMYDIGRKDYANDKAHQYTAGATEMFGLSHLMIMLSSNSSPIDVDSYLSSACAMYRLPSAKTSSGVLLRPLRATLLYYEAYRALDFYRSCPSALLRAAQDPGADLDVVGAMLIEQAAIADLRIFLRPALRKWAFHLVMAGHRYQQCGAKMLSLRCFRGAKAVYCGKTTPLKQFLDEEVSPKEQEEHDGLDGDVAGWTMIQAHVEHELGQQALNDGRTEQAIEHFLKTIRPTWAENSESTASLAARQSLHETYLRDLVAAFASLDVSRGDASPIESPFEFFDTSKSTFTINDKLTSDSDSTVWGTLEARLVPTFEGNIEQRNLLPSSRAKFGVVGEPVHLSLRVRNPLSAPITLFNLNVEVERESGSQTDTTNGSIEVDTIEPIQLAAREDKDVSITLTASSLGSFRVSRVSFNLQGMPPFLQELRKNGKRLNTTKEQKSAHKPIYAPDETLTITIQEPSPIFEAEFVDWPSRLGLGQEVDVVLRLSNRGKVAAYGRVMMAADKPEMILPKESRPTESYITVGNALNASQSHLLLDADQTLAAGQSIDITLRLRGAMLGESMTLRILFLSTSQREGYLSFNASHVIDIYPTVNLSVEVSPSSKGFAYDLAISAVNVHPDGQPLRITSLTFVSPRWASMLNSTLYGVHSTAQQALSFLSPDQPVVGHLAITEAAQDKKEFDSTAMMDYTVQHLTALLRGRDIDRGATAGPCRLSLSSSGSKQVLSGPSSFLAISRTVWRRMVLSHDFPALSSGDRDRIFTLYDPDDLDILVNWESHDGQDTGQVFLLGLKLGPSHSVMTEILSSLATGPGGGRNLYEETTREKAVLLSNLTRSYLGLEEDPLFVDIDVEAPAGEEADSLARETIGIRFIVRNMSTTRSAKCIVELESSVDPSGSGGQGSSRQGPEGEEYSSRAMASWIGRLTLRTPVIPPRGSVQMTARARRPRIGQECELADWSIKTDVLAEDGVGVLKRFHSGRLKSGKVV